MIIAIEKIANQFNEGTYLYFGCTIKITRVQKPFKYVTNTGKMATKSARYDGIVTFPNGDIWQFESQRGGAIARKCGLYVRVENENMTKQGDLYEMTNRRNEE